MSKTIIKPKINSITNKTSDCIDMDALNAVNGCLEKSTEVKDCPLPLPDPLPSVMSFDPEMLPESIREYVLDIADRQQSTPDFVAVSAVCGLAAVLGRKVLMRPKQNDDWTVTANQWGALIGRPSAMKSPSMKEALKPLEQIEAEAAKQYAADHMRYMAEKDLANLEKESTKNKAKELIKDGDRKGALEKLKQSYFVEPPPTRQRLVVNDTSVEKLGELLDQNPNGLIVVRDELSGWIAKLTEEENQGERAFYLECFDGNGRFIYDRIGRGTIEIKNCTLSVIGGIQPSKISPLVRRSISGTADDGLVQRLQLTVWPDDFGSWRWIDRAPNAIARTRYYDAFSRLHTLSFKTETGEPPYFRFTPAAQKLFIQWMERNQAAVRIEYLNPAMESHLLKMPQTIAGLALLFELVDGGNEAVDEIATLRALMWADYLKSHAERLYSIGGNPGITGAHLLLKRKSKLLNPFTAREVQRKGWSGLDNTNSVNEALEWLIEYCYLRPIEIPTTEFGGRSTIQYWWHPQYTE